jgi:hypothetical protein
LGLRGHRRAAGGPCGSGAAPRYERDLEEAAPLGVEFIQHHLAMLLEIRAIVIVICAHQETP